jgi:hypothetical protein
MQNQSSIFILYGIVDYEGNTTLGAYTSYDKAVFALDAYKTELAVDSINGRYDHSVYDDYLIEETVINMPVID